MLIVLTVNDMSFCHNWNEYNVRHQTFYDYDYEDEIGFYARTYTLLSCLYIYQNHRRTVLLQLRQCKILKT